MSDEEQLVEQAEHAAEELIVKGAIAPHDLEVRLSKLDARLDGPVVGVAMLRLLRSGKVELSDDFDFVPAADSGLACLA